MSGLSYGNVATTALSAVLAAALLDPRVVAGATALPAVLAAALPDPRVVAGVPLAAWRRRVAKWNAERSNIDSKELPQWKRISMPLGKVRIPQKHTWHRACTPLAKKT